MAGFKFRLQPLLQMRERARDHAAQAYQQATHAVQQLKDQIDGLESEYESQRPLQTTADHQNVSPQRILDSQRFQLQIRQRINEMKEKLRLVMAESEKRRQALVESEKELKSLTKLKSKQEIEFSNAEQAKQQSALDHWAGIKYWKTQDSK